MAKDTAPQEKTEWKWRNAFDANTLQYGEKDEAAGKLDQFECDPEGHWAKGVTQGGFLVQVLSAPTTYSECKTYPKWNNLHGGSAHSNSLTRYDRYYSCSCSSGKVGARCRHLANLMIHWEKVHGRFIMVETEEEYHARMLEEARAEKEKKTMAAWNYFAKHVSHEPQGLAFSPERILKATGLQTNEYEADVADGILSEGKACLTEMTIGYDYAQKQVLTGKGVADGNHVQIILSHEKIQKMTCACGRTYLDEDRYSWYYSPRPKTICGHAMAVWTKLHERIVRDNPGDMTDFRAASLLRRLSGQGSKEGKTRPEVKEADMEKNLLLIPRIQRDKSEEMNLAFDIGRQGEKSYAVKGLQKLVDAVEGKSTYTMSKTAEVDFSRERFTEESEKWYRMILSRIRSVEQVNETMNRSRRNWYYSRELSAGTGIPLAESDLDIVYELAAGGEIQYQYGGRKEAYIVKVGEAHPRLEVTLRPRQDKGRLWGIELEVSMPRLLQGSLHRYILDDKHFGRVPSGDGVAILEAFHAPDGSGEEGYKCLIGEKRFAEFYYRIMPLLEDSKEIILNDQVGSLIDGWLPPEPEFVFYIDLDGRNITCNPRVRYGDEETALAGAASEEKQIRRDREQEERVIQSIRRFFPEADDKKGIFFTGADEDRLIQIMTDGLAALGEYGEVRGSEAFRRVHIRPAPSPKLSVSIDSGLLDLSIQTRDMTKQDLLNLLESYRLKKRWFRLESGDYVDLRGDNGLRELDETARAIDVPLEELVKGGVKLPKYRALYIDSLLEDHEHIAASRNREFKSLVRSFETIRDSDFEVSEGLSDVLRPYQTYGFRWLSTVAQSGFGGILADEMGLGKTLQMLAWLEMRRENGENRPALVVCPASLVYNWKEECRKFVPDLNAEPLAGNLAQRKKQMEEARRGAGADLYITSYDLLRRDITLFDGFEFSAVILDEAQYIKNARAAVSRAVRVLKAEHRFALTGTPIENRLSELWSIFDFLMPGFLYTASEFAEKYETPIMKRKDQEATSRLARMTEPFILRRKKTDVLKDLPEKLEEVRQAEMEPDQRKLYDAQVVHMRKMLASSGDTGEDKMRILAEITRLRQLCCDPSLLFEDYRGSSAKREACLELISSAMDGGHRMLVFSQFTSMLSLLADDLKKEGIPFFTITGATPKQERLRLVNEFNGGDVPVFLISLKAGGTGLNLVGADVVIHYDPWWNLAVQNQATDRAHRIGQNRQVTVLKLIASNTIEEKILQLQEAKRELADAIISGESGSLMSLSREELMELIG